MSNRVRGKWKRRKLLSIGSGVQLWLSDTILNCAWGLFQSINKHLTGQWLADLQSVGIPFRQNEPWMLLNGDGRTGVGARCWTAGGEAGRVHLCQVVSGRFPLQGQLDVEVLSDGRVHDATCQDVGETTVITRAPVGRGGRYRQNSYCNNYHSIISILICQ